MIRVTQSMDLIVANAVHDMAQQFLLVRAVVGRSTMTLPELLASADAHGVKVEDDVARRILSEIAMKADARIVIRLLKEAGAPATKDDLIEGLRHVLETQS